MNSYRYYKKTWIFLEESKEILLTEEEAKSILKDKGLMIRNTYDFDTKDNTSFWFIIKDKLEDISELPFSARRNIRISLRKYNFGIIDKERFLNSGYEILSSAQQSYKIKEKSTTEYDFRRMLDEYEQDGDIEYWVVKDILNGEIVGFSINRLKKDSCEYDTMCCKPESLRNRSYPYYGLVYSMNQYYLGEKKLKYVCDGSRSITEHSNIQPFLEHNFKFRKAYCKLNVYYKWWFGVAVKLLFPFRNLIPFRNVKAILRMEEYSRKSK